MKNYNLKFKILPHAADLKIQAYGENKRELFENAMIGMLEGARYRAKLKTKSEKQKISIKSMDLLSLLVDFLSEILYLVETRKEVYQKVEFKKFSDPSTGSGKAEIEAQLTGKELKRMGIHIKAVTYHDLDIHQEKDGSLRATILFDI